MSAALAIANVDGVAISVTAEAILARDHALIEARLIASVTTPETQQVAVDSLATLKRFLKELEASREAIKKPVLDLGRRIDAKAKEIGAEVAIEVSRVEKLVLGYQREQREIAERRQRAAEAIAETKRRREQEEADRLAAEQRRLEEEARNTENEEDRRLAAAKAETASALAQAAQTKAESVVAAPVAAPVKAAGMTVAPVWRFRVTDIVALYATRPDLCVLSESASAINSALRGGLRECAGLEIYEDLTATVRAAR